MDILTLQFGHFANHVGAHYWNFQDEMAAIQDQEADEPTDDPPVDLERQYRRADSGRDGSTSWQPRLVAVDLKGALGAWGAGGDEVLEDSNQLMGNLLWEYGVEAHREDPLESHPFQQDLMLEEQHGAGVGDEEGDEMVADAGAENDAGDGYEDAPNVKSARSASKYDFRNTVQTWTDYLKVELPTSSVRELQGLHHGVAPFLTYFDGKAIKGYGDEAVIDLVRRQLESCDRLDSVHTLVDAHNGFGGVANLVHSWLQEEQPKCGRLVMAVQPEAPAEEPPENALDGGGTVASRALGSDSEACAWVSTAFSFAATAALGLEAWVPVQVPLWSAGAPPALYDLRRGSSYEVSALIASALDTATLPYRLQGGMRPAEFLGALAPAHRPVCGLLQALPLPAPPHAPAGGGYPRGGPAPPAETLAGLSAHFFDLSGMPVRPRNQCTSVVLRGGDPRRLVGWCGELPPLARRLSFAYGARLPLPLTFPQVFAPSVSAQGALPAAPPGRGQHAPRPLGVEVESCPTATYVHSVTGAGPCAPLKRMASATKAALRSGWGAAARAHFDVELDEFREVIETVVEHLESGAASCSDSGCDMDED